MEKTKLPDLHWSHTWGAFVTNSLFSRDFEVCIHTGLIVARLYLSKWGMTNIKKNKKLSVLEVNGI